MDKELFKVHMNYLKLENDLYIKLEKEIGSEKADELLDTFMNYREQFLKVGKYLDLELYDGRNGFLTKNHEGLERYLRVEVIYNYDDGYSLCTTTNGLMELVPTGLIRFETE